VLSNSAMGLIELGLLYLHQIIGLQDAYFVVASFSWSEK